MNVNIVNQIPYFFHSTKNMPKIKFVFMIYYENLLSNFCNAYRRYYNTSGFLTIFISSFFSLTTLNWPFLCKFLFAVQVTFHAVPFTEYNTTFYIEDILTPHMTQYPRISNLCLVSFRYVNV